MAAIREAHVTWDGDLASGKGVASAVEQAVRRALARKTA